MSERTLNLRLPTAEIARIDQYMGPWAILEERMRSLLETVRGHDLFAHVATAKRSPRRPRIGAVEVRPVACAAALAAGGPVGSGAGAGGRSGIVNIAIVDIVGVMTKYGSSMSSAPGCVELTKTIRNLSRDADVGAIMLRIDSPGGSTAGVADLAAEIRQASAAKPIAAYIEDLGASAAYWCASQCRSIWCNRSALVGSIGTYMVLYDSSAMAEQMGLKVHVVRAGEMKGAGTDGTPVTDEQLADFQRVVNEINSVFVGDVAAGRQLDRKDAETLADGRVHVGAGAVSLKLADGVATFDEALSQLASMAGMPQSTQASAVIPVAAHPAEDPVAKNSKADENLKIKSEETEKEEEKAKTEEEETDETEAEGEEMEDEEEEEEETSDSKSAKAATSKQLREEFPKSTAEWREKCVEAGLSVKQARAMYSEAAEATTPRAPGNQRPLRNGAAPSGRTASAGPGGAHAKLLAIADAKRAENRSLSRNEAWLAACRENPELRAAHVKEHNERNGRRVPA